MSLQLSVLDQAPIRRGSNAVEALQESVELVKLAEKLGYTRYWLSEHHNTLSLAMAAPFISMPGSVSGHRRSASASYLISRGSAPWSSMTMPRPVKF